MRIYTAAPVPGAREGIQALRDMGYRLIIVTARLRTAHQDSWEWVDRHFPSVSWHKISLLGGAHASSGCRSIR